MALQKLIKINLLNNEPMLEFEMLPTIQVNKQEEQKQSLITSL